MNDISILHPDGSRTIVENFGDGNGLRTDYDVNGDIVSTQDISGLSLPPNARETITGALDMMPGSAAAPILEVLELIATFTSEQIIIFKHNLNQMTEVPE